MENNHFLQMTNDPVKYMVFKKEFIMHLAGYHKITYHYEDNVPLSKIFANTPYQNGALLLLGGEISITFNEKDGNGYIVFNEYAIDIITLIEFANRGFIIECDISPMDDFNKIVASLSEEK